MEDLFSIYLEGSIIVIEFFKDTVSDNHDLEVAANIKKSVFDLLEQSEKRYMDITFCLSSLGDSTKHAGPEARSIYNSIFSHNKIRKVAIVHKSAFMNTILNYFIRMRKAISRNPQASVRVFNTREKARAWLAQGEKL